MKKSKLMLATFVLTFVSWLVLVYVFDMIFLILNFDFSHNIILNSIFMDRELLNCKALACRTFSGFTIFDVALLFVVGFIWKKYYYFPRLKK